MPPPPPPPPPGDRDAPFLPAVKDENSLLLAASEPNLEEATSPRGPSCWCCCRPPYLSAMFRSFLAGYLRGLTSLGEHRAVSASTPAYVLLLLPPPAAEAAAAAAVLRPGAAACGLSEDSRGPLAASLPAQYSFPGDRTSREFSLASAGQSPLPSSLMPSAAAAEPPASPSPLPLLPLLPLLLLLPLLAAESQSVFRPSRGDAGAWAGLRRDGEPRRPTGEPSPPPGDLGEAAVAGCRLEDALEEAVEEGEKSGRFLRGRGEGVAGGEQDCRPLVPSSAGSRGDWGWRDSCSCEMAVVSKRKR